MDGKTAHPFVHPSNFGLTGWDALCPGPNSPFVWLRGGRMHKSIGGVQAILNTLFVNIPLTKGLPCRLADPKLRCRRLSCMHSLCVVESESSSQRCFLTQLRTESFWRLILKWWIIEGGGKYEKSIIPFGIRNFWFLKLYPLFQGNPLAFAWNECGQKSCGSVRHHTLPSRGYDKSRWNSENGTIIA